MHQAPYDESPRRVVHTAGSSSGCSQHAGVRGKASPHDAQHWLWLRLRTGALSRCFPPSRCHCLGEHLPGSGGHLGQGIEGEVAELDALVTVRA